MYTILFNEFNPDSVLATHILGHAILAYDGEAEIKLIAHNVYSVLDSKESEKTFAVGVHLDRPTIAQICSCGHLYIFNYGEPIDVASANEISVTHVHPFKDGSNVEDVHDKSLSKLVMSADVLGSLHNGIKVKYIEIADAVFKYTNFIRMSEAELETYYNYRDAIYESVTKPFEALTPLNLKIKQHPVLKAAKKIVERTLCKQLYGDNHKNKYVPTINIIQEYMYEGGRQIQYAHESFVMYEDSNNKRLWIIYSRNPKTTVEISDMIPHDLKWNDNNFIFLIGDQPSLTK
jgi:hypothetical protein